MLREPSLMLNCLGWKEWRESWVPCDVMWLIFQTSTDNLVFDKQGELMGMFIIWFRLSIAASDISDMSPAHGLGLDHECCSCLERIEANVCIAKKQRKHTKALSNCWTKDMKRLGLQESQWPPKQSMLRLPAFNAHHWLFTRKAKLSCLDLGRVTFETLDIGLQIIYIHLLMKILLLLPLTLISFWGRIRRIHWQQNLLVKRAWAG